MKLRTLIDLTDFLDDEFAWRRKELTSIWSDIKQASISEKPARLRSAVTMLYAHWEGFVKQAGDGYLAFVACKRLKLGDLSPCFIALALRAKLAEFASTDEPGKYAEFVRYFQSSLGHRARIPTKGVVATRSNLSSDIFRRIVAALGLDYTAFELKEKFLDSQLLYLRNNIAHGKGLYPSESQFDAMYEEVNALMREFKTQVENAASLNLYLSN